ncbi:hypothetical protein [Pseudarthrobacter sp. AB1]|uniref:hypothetical protein n=1 Tax=Pseudarthrobacter sp. AB1 TaxID=2138309 RepID=UPI00186B970A|nr:hypothetical protein [Pseudarthrobacter sp. AB1]MBE4717277.1 hypothetical protein [Pseudarthrobacter sp. AB1]
MTLLGILLIAAGITSFYWFAPCFERFGLTPATPGGKASCVLAAVIASLIVSGIVVLVPWA